MSKKVGHRLKGKVAIITGGASGIGKGIADCMANEGAEIVVADINVKGAKYFARRADVRVAGDFKKLFEAVQDKYGKIDVLVNNAGTFSSLGMPFTDVLEGDWQKMWDMHVNSVRYSAAAIKPYFEKQRSGSMINVSSIAALLSSPIQPAYAIAKSAVIALSRILAKEFAMFGARVNVIAPGLVYTPAWESLALKLKAKNPALAALTPKEVFDAKVKEIAPLKTEQTPEDIAMAAVFLASDEARCITGHILPVDSGVTMY